MMKMKIDIVKKLEMIAIFMQCEKVKNTTNSYYIPENAEYIPIMFSYDFELKQYYKPEEMKYNSSWNWLMPVVLKILIDSYPLEGVKKMKRVQDSLITCSLEKTFKSVCEFIEYYETAIS